MVCGDGITTASSQARCWWQMAKEKALLVGGRAMKRKQEVRDNAANAFKVSFLKFAKPTKPVLKPLCACLDELKLERPHELEPSKLREDDAETTSMFSFDTLLVIDNGKFRCSYQYTSCDMIFQLNLRHICPFACFALVSSSSSVSSFFCPPLFLPRL